MRLMLQYLYRKIQPWALVLMVTLVITGGILVPLRAADAFLIEAITVGAISLVLTTILYAIVYFFGALIAGPLIVLLIAIATYNDFGAEYGVILGWTVIRDVSNMFFVVVLLAIAIATIFKVESYSYRQLLPKLVIMAVLINFSKSITLFFVDISQIVMLTFVNSFKDIAGGNILTATGITKVFSYSVLVKEGIVGGQIYSILGSMLLALAITVITAGVLLVLIVIFVFRIVMLWILIILSPLAYILAVLPGGQRYASQWWERFIPNLITGPVLAFFLWLSFTIMQNNTYIYREGSSFDRLLQQERTTPQAFNPFETEAGRLDSMFNFVIVIALLLGSLAITQQIGGVAASFAGSVAGKFQTLGAAPLKGLAKVGGAMASGTGKSIASTLGISDDWLSKEGIKKAWEEGVTRRNARVRRQRVRRRLAAAREGKGVYGLSALGAMGQIAGAPGYFFRHNWDWRTFKELGTTGAGKLGKIPFIGGLIGGGGIKKVFGQDFQALKRQDDLKKQKQMELEEEMERGDVSDEFLAEVKAQEGQFQHQLAQKRERLLNIDPEEIAAELERLQRIQDKEVVIELEHPIKDKDGKEVKNVSYKGKTKNEYIEFIKQYVPQVIEKYKKQGFNDKEIEGILGDEFEERSNFQRMAPEQQEKEINLVRGRLSTQREELIQLRDKAKEGKDKTAVEQWQTLEKEAGEINTELDSTREGTTANNKKLATKTYDELSVLRSTDRAEFEKRAAAYVKMRQDINERRAALLDKKGLTESQLATRRERLQQLSAPGGLVEKAKDDIDRARALNADEATIKELEKIYAQLQAEQNALRELDKLYKALEEMPGKLGRLIATGADAAALKTETDTFDNTIKEITALGEVNYVGVPEGQDWKGKYDGGKKSILASDSEVAENKSQAQQIRDQSKKLDIMLTNPLTTADRERIRREIDDIKKERFELKKKSEGVRPAYDYETLQAVRNDIDEEERKLTTENWKELVRIAEDAMKEGDGVRVAAALRKATRSGNENEFQNWFNYSSGGEGLKHFVMGELVGTSGGLTKDMADKMGLKWDNYIDKYGIEREGFGRKKGMGLATDLGIAIGNDVAYIGEGIGHWGVARTVDADYFTGEPMWAKELDRNIEILAEIEKGDFEGFMRNKNRLALFEEVPYSKDDFRENGRRQGHILPAGASYYIRNYWKMPRILSQGRIQPSMQKNFANPETVRILERIASSMPDQYDNINRTLRMLKESVATIPQGFPDVPKHYGMISRYHGNT